MKLYNITEARIKPEARQKISNIIQKLRAFNSSQRIPDDEDSTAEYTQTLDSIDYIANDLSNYNVEPKNIASGYTKTRWVNLAEAYPKCEIEVADRKCQMLLPNGATAQFTGARAKVIASNDELWRLLTDSIEQNEQAYDRVQKIKTHLRGLRTGGRYVPVNVIDIVEIKNLEFDGEVFIPNTLKKNPMQHVHTNNEFNIAFWNNGRHNGGDPHVIQCSTRELFQRLIKGAYLYKIIDDNKFSLRSAQVLGNNDIVYVISVPHNYLSKIRRYVNNPNAKKMHNDTELNIQLLDKDIQSEEQTYALIIKKIKEQLP